MTEKPAEPPPLGRIVETALYCDDLARARDFYVTKLGGTVMLDTERLLAVATGGASVLLLFRRGATLEPLQSAGGLVPAHGAHGVQHLAFAIEEGDLARWRERLHAVGIAIESEVTWPRGGRSLYVRDPDGHSVEFITPGLWTIY